MQTRRPLLPLAAACGLGLLASPPATGDKQPDFEQYQLVLLRAGPKAQKLPEAEVQRIQAQHLMHLRQMGTSGKMVLAGPFGDQEDETLRGMCLYRVATIAEARHLAEGDPAVKAGRLKVEVMTWYVEKGYVAFPRAPK